MSAVTRRYEIRRRRKRQATQRRLKARLLKAKSHAETEKLLRKLRAVSLAAPLREFTQQQNRGGHTRKAA